VVVQMTSYFLCGKQDIGRFKNDQLLFCLRRVRQFLKLFVVAPRPPAAAPGVGRLACRIRRPRPSATALWERAVFAAVARYRWVSRQAAVAGRQASERARCSRVWPEVEQHVPPCVTLTTVGKPRPGPRVAHCRILQRHSLPDSCR
jgi:hypothetical protein